MKQKMIVLMTSVLFCYCAGNERLSEIGGTYVNHSEGEYSVADDTLVINSISSRSYSITRKTGFQKVRDGKLLPKEQRREELTAIYEPRTRQLQETKRGRIITVNKKTGLVRMEATEYKKLP
ncbi:hypothetical protein [Daejeonella sp.]|uniref:hypothetical protein n=1 Tax=Daejeonella sp. TaxID=2805397 RepID=UPI0030BFA250